MTLHSICDAGMFSGMRAKGPKADLALIVADVPAAAAGVFTTNVMAAAPVTFCWQALQNSPTAQAVGGHICTTFSCWLHCTDNLDVEHASHCLTSVQQQDAAS